ncbi:MAG TPA: type II toxin-antitoxin system prevent-host-death family antitoxin [Nitriliruptorales bacterium]
MGDDQEVMASRFKAECLALLDQVAETGSSYVITKYGRPVARLVPLEQEGGGTPTAGSVTVVAEDDESLFSTGERWDVEPGT